MLAFKAGLIHRDLSDGNIMIHDGEPFKGFLLDFDYSFSWMEALDIAGRSVDEATWATYVDEHNEEVAGLTRSDCSAEDLPPQVMGKIMQPGCVDGRKATWVQKIKMKERTVCSMYSRCCR